MAEAVSASVVAFSAFTIFGAYFTDWTGLTISPVATFIVSAALSAIWFLWLGSTASRTWTDLCVFTAIVAAMAASLLWWQWPDLLLPGGGADLAHHLQLVEYIDRHWRLVHDPPIEAYLGEMVHYTPGAHLLASLIGRWMGTDGFHAIYCMLAVSVALKVGLVFLIARRSVEGSWPFAVLAPILLLLPTAFFFESFARYSYVPQVVSECFAVCAWWAVVAWNDRPSLQALVIFAVSGAASFLTWPVFAGPPVAALAITIALARDVNVRNRTTSFLIATVPIAIVAVVHAMGRVGWARIVKTSADMAVPAWSSFSWPLLVLAAAGLAVMMKRRRALATGVLTGAIAVQALALFVLARADGAAVPYLAIKMAYLVIYPLAVCAAITVSMMWSWTAGRMIGGRIETVAASATVAALCLLIARATLPVTRQKPTVSEPLYLAGRWARDHVPDPACVDYIVTDNHTAYWLHLAVLGNRRMSPRTADDRTFDPREQIIRWINPGGLPYAVADLAAIPKDVLAENEELARFGSAVVIRRRGTSACGP